MADRLGAAFVGKLAEPLEPKHAATVDAEVEALVQRARDAAPGIALDPVAFVEYVAERVTLDKHGAPKLRGLHAKDLWVAFGCVIADQTALATFEVDYAPEIRAALARSFERGLAEDAELKLRERLLLVAADDAPRLASYAGRGDLRAWLRAAAVRIAIDLMRARRELPVDPGALGEVGPAIDPLLASLKQRYRDEFRIAFDEAARALTDRERTLLRYRFLDGLSIDEIGVLYRVHRATVARWIAAIREGLFETTRERLMRRLSISDSEADSVLRLIDSQLDVSISVLVR